MPEEKTLFELGVEYEKAAECVKKRIAERRLRLKNLGKRIYSNEAFVLKSELNALYKEYCEARETAKYLKNYYKNNNKNEWGGIAA